MYSSLKHSSYIPPIDPYGFLDVCKYKGIAPLIINAPWHTDLWLFLSYKTKSPGAKLHLMQFY